MSVDSVSEQSHRRQWSQADEIDLAHYFGVLRRHWLVIALVTVGFIVLTAVAVLLYRQLTPPVYEASATAAIVRTSTDVRFDERFTTSAEPTTNLNVNSRRAALVAMVRSGSIAQQVIDELGDQLPPQEQDPAKLLEMVSAKVATAGQSGQAGQSDLIEISALASSPALAATIANTWAKAYVQQVNSVYGQVPDDMLGSVEAQLVKAQTTYDNAQANLESFLATSQFDTLTRQSAVLSQTLTILQQGKVNALQTYMQSLVDSYGNIVQTYVGAQADNQTLPFLKEQEGQRGRIAAYLDAYNAAQVDTFTEQNDRYRSELRMYYDQWLRTNSLLAAARTLQKQVVGNNTVSPSSALALQVLNLQMVNAAAATPPQPSTQYLTTGQPQAQPQNQAQIQQQIQQPDQSGQLQTQPSQQQIILPQQPAQSTSPAQTTPLQIQLDGSTASSVITAADLQRQVDATIASLESQLTTLEQDISNLNRSLLSGDNFQNLNTAVPANSALVQAIANAYPSLFQAGVFSTTASQMDSSALFAAGQTQAAQFLAQAEADTLPTANSPDAPMAATIAQLEDQLRTLQSRIEVERGRNLQFTQQRDLAWESVKALSNKQAELLLARAAANSEVRLSGLAIPLDEPVQRISLIISLAFAAIVGLLFGIVAAFIRELTLSSPLRARPASNTP